MRKSGSGGLVYSTEGGRMCPACRQPAAACVCRVAPVLAPGDGVVRISRSSKGRSGKTVTLVQGVPLEGPALAELAQALRSACGAGGTVKDGVIEIQGEHRERVRAALAPRGWTVKLAGA